MSSNPHANGGLLLKDLKKSDYQGYAVEVPPHKAVAEAMRVMDPFLRDVMKRNMGNRNFLVFRPGKTVSNRLHTLLLKGQSGLQIHKIDAAIKLP